jgi:hypothetical protein
MELEKLKKMLNNEKLLKQQAVNKLAEIMNRKDFNKKDRRAENKATSAELRKKEKENRRLQQELTMEKEKFNQMVAKYTKDLQDLQATLYEESQARCQRYKTFFPSSLMPQIEKVMVRLFSLVLYLGMRLRRLHEWSTF